MPPLRSSMHAFFYGRCTDACSYLPASGPIPPQIGASPAAYKAAYAAGRHVISDGLKRLPHRPKVNDSGWVNYTAGEAVRQARLRLA